MELPYYYVNIANQIKEVLQNLGEDATLQRVAVMGLAQRLANVFSTGSTNFDRTRFLVNCGFPEEDVKFDAEFFPHVEPLIHKYKDIAGISECYKIMFKENMKEYMEPMKPKEEEVADYLASKAFGDHVDMK